MLKKERQAKILHQLNLHNKVVSADLCSRMGVSEDTVRRDLQELADEGRLIKVHGGALSPVFHQLHRNEIEVYAAEKKQQIASKAIALVQAGMFVLTGGGTTILEVARQLPTELRATFMTGSIPLMNVYLSKPCLEVVIIGDKVSREANFTVGSFAIEQIKQVNADLCLLGINAFDSVAGLTDNDLDVVQVKKAMIESSKKVACITISEKLGSIQPFTVCGASDIDYLVTELEPTHPTLKPFIDQGINVI